MLFIDQSLLSLLLALACAPVPWLAQSLRSSLLAIGLVVLTAVAQHWRGRAGITPTMMRPALSLGSRRRDCAPTR
jgi:hypothetical protein